MLSRGPKAHQALTHTPRFRFRCPALGKPQISSMGPVFLDPKRPHTEGSDSGKTPRWLSIPHIDGMFNGQGSPKPGLVWSGDLIAHLLHYRSAWTWITVKRSPTGVVPDATGKIGGAFFVRFSGPSCWQLADVTCREKRAGL